MPFNQNELLRYARHFSLPEVGEAGQVRLKEAKVLCIGAGGLGCPVLLYLAAAGIGTLGIIDDDKIDLSNLQRQILYNSDEIGQSKTSTAKAKLHKLNPHNEVITYPTKLNEANALEVLAAYDIIVDCSDNFSTRYLINDACFHLQKPYVYASVAQFSGQASVFCLPDGPCYRCLFPTVSAPGLIPNCAEGGVLGVLPGLMGTLQANEVIKLVLGIGETLKGRLLTINALTMQFETFKITQNPTCLLCQQHTPFNQLKRITHCASSANDIKQISPEQLQRQKKNVFLLDVREPWEHEAYNLGGHLIPLGQLPQRLHKIPNTKPIIIYCKSGARSLSAAKILSEAGFNNIANLAGGILAWLKEGAKFG